MEKGGKIPAERTPRTGRHLSQSQGSVESRRASQSVGVCKQWPSLGLGKRDERKARPEGGRKRGKRGKHSNGGTNEKSPNFQRKQEGGADWGNKGEQVPGQRGGQARNREAQGEMMRKKVRRGWGTLHSRGSLSLRVNLLYIQRYSNPRKE